MPMALQKTRGVIAGLLQGMGKPNPADHVPEEKTMARHIDVTEVGAPDPELRTSPIFDDAAGDVSSYDSGPEGGICYFNGLFRLS